MQVDVLGSSLRVAHAPRLIGFGGRALNRLDWQIGLILDDAGASSGFKSSLFQVCCYLDMHCLRLRHAAVVIAGDSCN
jgi:hypothetical protein